MPIWVHDGGDGTFGDGDSLEFVGEILAGENTFFNEYTSRNVYRLSTAQASPARMQPRPAPRASSRPKRALAFEVRRHLEQDQFLLRLVGNQGVKQDVWHWAKLTQIDAAPFEVPLDLSDLDTSSAGAVRVRLDFRGWSQPFQRPTPETKDHAVDVLIGGTVVASTQWNNSEQEHELALPDMPASTLKPGTLSLQIRVPPRPGVRSTDSLVDVSLLNWVRVDYPRVSRSPAAQARVYAGTETAGASLASLRGEPSSSLVVFGDDGSRWEGASFVRAADLLWADPAGARRFDLVAGGKYLRPYSVVRDLPSDLRSTAHHADYIMVAHARLKAAIEPLAALLPLDAGSRWTVVDIQDVYDEFNHGILHPRALKDFLSHAYHKWQRPAPRYVLLVGDASWDSKNEKADEQPLSRGHLLARPRHPLRRDRRPSPTRRAPR